MVPDEAFSPAAVNVLDQRRDHHSPLTWMERALRIRKESPELGWGTATVLELDEPAVLATRIDWEVRTMVTVHNLAREGRQVTLPDADQYGTLTDVFADREYHTVDGKGQVGIDGSGYRWMVAVWPTTPSRSARSGACRTCRPRPAGQAWWPGAAGRPRRARTTSAWRGSR